MEKIRMIMVTDFSTKFHQIGLYVIIAMLIGTIFGFFIAERMVAKDLSNAITYKAIKIDGKEYDLKERI